MKEKAFRQVVRAHDQRVEGGEGVSSTHRLAVQEDSNADDWLNPPQTEIHP